MKKEINVLLIIVCIFLFTFYSCIQNTSLTKSDTGIGEDVLEIAKTLDENRIMKQSEILDCGELPGTFWVTAEPDIIDGKQYYFYGYIFLDRNYMIIVQVEQIHKTDKLF
jgi:hypothetical protein